MYSHCVCVHALYIGWQTSSICFGNSELTQHCPAGLQPVVHFLWTLHAMFCMTCLSSSSLLAVSSLFHLGMKWSGMNSMWSSSCTIHSLTMSSNLCLSLLHNILSFVTLSWFLTPSILCKQLCWNTVSFFKIFDVISRFSGISGNWGDESVVQVDFASETNCQHWPDWV